MTPILSLFPYYLAAMQQSGHTTLTQKRPRRSIKICQLTCVSAMSGCLPPLPRNHRYLVLILQQSGNSVGCAEEISFFLPQLKQARIFPFMPKHIHAGLTFNPGPEAWPMLTILNLRHPSSGYYAFLPTFFLPIPKLCTLKPKP